MTSRDFPHLQRFLRGVHRRLILWRVIERIGIGSAIASGLTLPLMAMLVWHGAAATEPVILCITMGIIGGAAWGATRIPSLLEAAIEADRQLQWADVLGTALALGATPEDPWQRAVLIDADRRCSGISSSSLLLRRLGPRTWSGIALLLMLVLTLSAWIGSPAQSLAHDATVLSPSASPASTDSDNRPLLSPIVIDSQRPSAAPPDAEDAAPANQTPTKEESASGATTRPTEADSSRDQTSAQGQGKSLGRSAPTPARTMPPPESVTIGRTPLPNGRAFGGNSAASDQLLAGTGTSSGRVGPGAANRPAVAPWTTSDWPLEMQAAGRAIDSGNIPPADRELVRDYFRRD